MIREITYAGSRTSVFLVLGFAACQPGDGVLPGGVAVEVRDSAGVRIVEHLGTPDARAPFQFSAQPRYRHGVNPGHYAFQRAHAGAILPDGSAVLSDPYSEELVAISPDGGSHEVLAREGDGPGDVRMVGNVLALGRDSALVFDMGLRRATVFVGGAFESATDLRAVEGLGVRGIGSAGRLLMSTNSFYSGFEEPWLPGHMARFDMGTGALDTVAAYDFAARPPSGLRYDPIGASGQVAVADGRFVHARTDRPEITWRRPDGSVAQIVRWQAEPGRLTEEMIEGLADWIREAYRMANPGAADADIERMADNDLAGWRARVGGPLPLFSALLADAEGRAWLPAWSPRASREGVSRYTVIAADGAWLGTVEAPPRLRILDVAGGLVLGAQQDELNVESVVLYELARDADGEAPP